MNLKYGRFIRKCKKDIHGELLWKGKTYNALTQYYLKLRYLRKMYRRKVRGLDFRPVLRVVQQMRRIRKANVVSLTSRRKLCVFYGDLSLKEFKKINLQASRLKFKPLSEALVGLLESRLDTVLFRSRIALNFFLGKQMIKGGCVLVNKRIVRDPGYYVLPGDFVEIVEFMKKYMYGMLYWYSMRKAYSKRRAFFRRKIRYIKRRVASKEFLNDQVPDNEKLRWIFAKNTGRYRFWLRRFKRVYKKQFGKYPRIHLKNWLVYGIPKYIGVDYRTLIAFLLKVPGKAEVSYPFFKTVSSSRKRWLQRKNALKVSKYLFGGYNISKYAPNRFVVMGGRSVTVRRGRIDYIKGTQGIEWKYGVPFYKLKRIRKKWWYRYRRQKALAGSLFVARKF